SRRVTHGALPSVAWLRGRRRRCQQRLRLCRRAPGRIRTSDTQIRSWTSSGPWDSESEGRRFDRYTAHQPRSGPRPVSFDLDDAPTVRNSGVCGPVIVLSDTAVDLARAQFATTSLYHFLFVPLTLGLGPIVAIFQTQWQRTGDEAWLKLTH